MHGTSGSGNCKLRGRGIDKWPYDKIRKSEGLAYGHSARIRFLDLKSPERLCVAYYIYSCLFLAKESIFPDDIVSLIEDASVHDAKIVRPVLH